MNREHHFKEKYKMKSKWRIIFLMIWILLFILDIWAYNNQGKYIHIMTMDITAVEREFEIYTVAGNRNVQVVGEGKNLALDVEQVTDQNFSTQTMKGRIDKENLSEKQRIYLYCDDDSPNGNWEIRGSAGISSIEYSRADVENAGSFIYVWIAVLMIAVPLYLYGSPAARKYRKTAQTAFLKFLDTYESSETWKNVNSNMRRDFLRLERKRIWNQTLGITSALSCALFFWRNYEYGIVHPWAFIRNYLSVMALALIVFIILDVLWEKEFSDLLTNELKPVSAAVLCLWEVMEGDRRFGVKRLMLHNVAVGFLRGGEPEIALYLMESCLNYKKRWSVSQFADSQIKELCAEYLGDESQAKKERIFQKDLIEKKSSLKKTDSVRRHMLTQNMKDFYKKGELEKAKAYGEICLSECGTAYRRLPVLYILVQIYMAMGDKKSAEEIIGEILKYSPENREVRGIRQMLFSEIQAEYEENSWDKKVCLEKGGRKKGFIQTGICMLLGLMTLVLILIILRTCISENVSFTRPVNVPINEYVPAQEGASKDEAAETPHNGLQEREPVKNREPESSEASRLPSFTVTLPKSWEGLVQEDDLLNGGKVYRQKKSYDAMGDGTLFSISVYEDHSYVNLPDYSVWGYDNLYVYVMSRPADVSFYAEDGSVRDEYRMLEQDLDDIRPTFRILSSDAYYDGEQFVFARSHLCYIEEEELYNLSASELRTAKNEIYARHERKFEDVELQRYFNSCSWYQGNIDPEDFDDSVMNLYEKSNILLIQKRQNEME